MSDFPQSQGNNAQLPPLKLNALDEIKLRLFAPVEGSRRPAALRASIAKNQPRLTVYTNVEGDADKGIIHARMDTWTFGAMLIAIDDIVDNKTEKVSIPNKRPKG
jgi:hypothetical protein